jgi:predicted nuclease of predicted toxin-antitoxin system
MKLLVDECLPKPFVTALQAKGYDVGWVRELYRGYSDEQILAVANVQSRVIVTEDRDFGRLTIQYRLPAVGIVLVQVSDLPGDVVGVATYTANAIAELHETCVGSLTVIGVGRHRQRPLRTNE